MTNLATLIGTTNLQSLINSPANTYVVVENGKYEYTYLKTTSNIDYSKVVGIGSYDDCLSLCGYLNLEKLANL